MDDRFPRRERVSLKGHPPGPDVVRLEDVRLRGTLRFEGDLAFPRGFHLLRRIETGVDLPRPCAAEAIRPMDLLPREDGWNRIEFRVRGRRHRALPHDHRHGGLLRSGDNGASA